MHWLFKSEPETYSFETLLKEKRTNWNGVRNFQARNFLKQCRVGDLVLIYHSGKERAVVGIAKIAKAAYPDPDPENPGDWFQVDVTAVHALKRPVELSEIKENPALKELRLLKQSRLSVMPISDKEYQILIKFN